MQILRNYLYLNTTRKNKKNKQPKWNVSSKAYQHHMNHGYVTAPWCYKKCSDISFSRYVNSSYTYGVLRDWYIRISTKFYIDVEVPYEILLPIKKENEKRVKKKKNKNIAVSWITFHILCYAGFPLFWKLWILNRF